MCLYHVGYGLVKGYNATTASVQSEPTKIQSEAKEYNQYAQKAQLKETYADSPRSK